MSAKKPYTAREIAWAKRRYLEDKARGQLKAPRAIAALARANAPIATVSATSVTYRDFLADARRALAGQPKPRSPRPRKPTRGA
jgi:hypothetical protein